MRKETIGDADLYLCDCAEIEVPHNLLVTDPPYGQEFESGKAGGKWGPIAGDDSPDLVHAQIKHVLRGLARGRHAYIFGNKLIDSAIADLQNMSVGQTAPQTENKHLQERISELKMLLEAKNLAYEGKVAEVAALVHQKAEEKLRADQNFDSYERCTRALLALKNRYDEAMRVLQLILPLAKGYAAENPVGSNAQYIEEAEKVMAQQIIFARR